MSSSHYEPPPRAELPSPLYQSRSPQSLDSQHSHNLPRTSQLAGWRDSETSSDSSSSNLSMASGNKSRGGRGGGQSGNARGARGGRGARGRRGGRGDHHGSGLANTTPVDEPRAASRPRQLATLAARPSIPPLPRSDPGRPQPPSPTASGPTAAPQAAQSTVLPPAAGLRVQQRAAALQAVTTQQSYVDTSGNHIQETQIVRPRVMTEHVPRTAQEPTTAQVPPMAQAPPTAQKYQVWPHHTLKIKIFRLPKEFWTGEVHQAMSVYGYVLRVEIKMEKRSPYNQAFVEFQLPLSMSLPPLVQFGDMFLHYEKLNSPLKTVTSAIHPGKRYRESNTIHANTLEFGMQKAATSMVSMFTVQTDWKVQLTLDLYRKELDIRFPLKVNDQMRNFRFRLPISLLSHIYKVQNAELGQTVLIIPFDRAPQFFQQKWEREQLPNGRRRDPFDDNDNDWVDWNTWYRETDIVEGAYERRLQDLPVMNHKGAVKIDIGRWTSYRLSFDNATLAKDQFNEFSNILAEYGVPIEPIAQYSVQARSPSPLWTSLYEEISGTHPHFNFEEDRANHFREIPLRFSVRYQLEACLSHGFIKEHNITDVFLMKLRELDHEQATSLLERVTNKKCVFHDPMEVFNMRISSGPRKPIPSYCVLQQSVVITPTMMHVNTPVMETSNRITRKHSAYADRFIRVKFSDELGEGPLRTMPDDRAEATFERVRRAMKNGIVVAGRHYEFLAFGNSQFRENGAYFYSRAGSNKSAHEIRSSLGNFDHIRSVAKFGARLGQAFSTTRNVNLSVQIKNIEDIERNGHVFTDGVGKLSLFMASMAAQDLGLSNPFVDPPSLFQFRLGGYKGVLAVDPGLKGREVHIRPSQQKFETESRHLEIIRSSSFSTPFFNRQIVIVLSFLGVSSDIFIKKQQRMVDDYERAMSVAEVAIDRLRSHVDQNETTLTMAGMVLDGFMSDPFVMSLLKLWRAYTIKYLKEKARIAVDDGAFVLGCIDETAKLKGHFDHLQPPPDAIRDEKLAKLPEIFIQIDDTSPGRKGHYKVIKGICVLARNPSLHPGDIRVVRAVDVPELHHLKNVVVLPQTGDRDLASMCSGGDLDGDDYMVLWDEDLIPEKVNVEPMDFTPEKPPEVNRPVSVADITEFFVTYMKNNTLGQIGYAHLAQADKPEHGVGSATCLALAKLHSKAVDYNKSGIPAVLTAELRPKTWPHFMEKKHVHASKIYKSKGVLGQLYDGVELIAFVPQYEAPFDPRILTAYDLAAELLQKVAEVKQQYDDALRRLMAKYAIETEFEVWSVFILKHNHETNKYKFVEDFGRTICALKTQFREICRAEAGVKERANLGPFAAAMYTVTAREVEDALKECRTMKVVNGQEKPLREMVPAQMPFISFPWLFPDDLGKIAHESRRDTVPTLRLPQPKNRQGSSGLTKKTGTKLNDVEETVKAVVASLHPGDVLDLGNALAQAETQVRKNGLRTTSTSYEASEFSFTTVGWTPAIKKPTSIAAKIGTATLATSTSGTVINGTVAHTGATSDLAINETATSTLQLSEEAQISATGLRKTEANGGVTGHNHVEPSLDIDSMVTARLADAKPQPSEIRLRDVEVNDGAKAEDVDTKAGEQEEVNLNVETISISEPFGLQGFEIEPQQLEGEGQEELNVVIKTKAMPILDRLSLFMR